MIKDSAAILTITYNKLKHISSHAQYVPNQLYSYTQIQICDGQLKDSSTTQIISLENQPTSAKDFNAISNRRFCNPKLKHLMQYVFLIEASLDQPKITQRIVKNWKKYQKLLLPAQGSDITLCLTKPKGDTISIILDSTTFNIKQITNTYSTRMRGYLKKLNSNQESTDHNILTTSFSYKGKEVHIDSISWIIHTELFNKETETFYPHELVANLRSHPHYKLPTLPQDLKSIRTYLPCSAYFLE